MTQPTKNRYPTKEELEKIKKIHEDYKIKKGWTRPKDSLPELTEDEFMGKLTPKEI
jgi:hypothetical protein